MGTLRAFIPHILAARSLLTAGSSPPFPRAAETSGGSGAQVSHQPRVAGAAGAAGRADPERIPEHGGPGSSPSATRGQLKSVSPAAADLLAATAGGAGTQRSPWPAGVAVTPETTGWEAWRTWSF